MVCQAHWKVALELTGFCSSRIWIIFLSFMYTFNMIFMVYYPHYLTKVMLFFLSGPNTYNENETIAKYEIMDGAPVRGLFCFDNFLLLCLNRQKVLLTHWKVIMNTVNRKNVLVLQCCDVGEFPKTSANHTVLSKEKRCCSSLVFW